jgi:hypothetical protein
VQELASLGPNGTVFPVMAYSFSFLSIAAIQRISSAAAEGRTQDVGHLMRQAMLLSVVSLYGCLRSFSVQCEPGTS